MGSFIRSDVIRSVFIRSDVIRSDVIRSVIIRSVGESKNRFHLARKQRQPLVFATVRDPGLGEVYSEQLRSKPLVVAKQRFIRSYSMMFTRAAEMVLLWVVVKKMEKLQKKKIQIVVFTICCHLSRMIIFNAPQNNRFSPLPIGRGEANVSFL